MGDLEVMCRECHDAHHRAEDRSRERKRNAIGRKVIFRYLTEQQRADLATRFNIFQIELQKRIQSDDFFAYLAAGILGFKYVCEGFVMPRHRLIVTHTQKLIQVRGRKGPKRKHVTGKIRSSNRSGC